MKLTSLLIAISLMATASTAFAQSSDESTNTAVQEFPGGPGGPGGGPHPGPGPGGPGFGPHPGPGGPGPGPRPPEPPRPPMPPRPPEPPRPPMPPMPPRPPEPPRPPMPPMPPPRPIRPLPPVVIGDQYYNEGCAQNTYNALCVGQEVYLNDSGYYATVEGYAYTEEGVKYEIEYSNGSIDTGYTRDMLTLP